jgi:pimeloyl-ACP methyl ester carboxylesterase
MVGAWLGTLEVAGMKLRLVLNFTVDENGELTAAMDSPDQGASGIPIDDVSLSGDTLAFAAAALMLNYVGVVDSSRSSVVGDFTQGGQVLPLTLQRTEQAPSVKRPQEPKPPFPYTVEEVSYENAEDGITLAGTLTLPPIEHPMPAVLLITGSGPQDRDEMVFGHRPFWVLADYLTRRGLAVLRVDDRGVGGSTGDATTATTVDFRKDAEAGVMFLQNRPEIDRTKIGLIGHSEGGLIAPMLAARPPMLSVLYHYEIAFIVLMAGPGVPGEQILIDQAELVFRAEGADEMTIARQRELQERMFQAIKNITDEATLEKKLRWIIDESTAGLSEEELAALNMSEGGLEQQIQMATSPWLRFFLTYDPRTSLQWVTCPVLAVAGELDLQVPSKANLEAINQALTAAGHGEFTTVEMPGLNHLFQTAATGSVSEYATIEETLSPDFLKLVGDWIMEHTE